MYRHFKTDEEDEELAALVPVFDETILPASAQRRIRRSAEQEVTDKLIKAIRAYNHNKLTMVNVLCQAQVQDAVTMLLQRNPSSNAAKNLFALADANAAYLKRLAKDDDDRIWGGWP